MKTLGPVVPIGHIDIVSMNANAARDFARALFGVSEKEITRVEDAGDPFDPSKHKPGARRFRLFLRDLRVVK